ncbi:MAG: methyltransferase domain-containing protein [Planctomycetota bacterium]|nr:methyltransferase domain-containing protein [Planctomycetota bacterium]MDA1142362.1 methyltransferase domain-containing protein [Planctomycetota bacterium]
MSAVESPGISALRIGADIVGKLACPCCKMSLVVSADVMECSSQDCLTRFPLVDGIPILLNEKSSVFSIKDFVPGEATFNPRAKARLIRRLVYSFLNYLPALGNNPNSRRNYSLFADALSKTSGKTRVLVVGGSIVGKGMEQLIEDDRIDFVETDISIGPRTMMVCDAHDLPFEAETFDGIIIQAVLEHVLDPFRCVEEIYRVLKANGIVYAEIPFMQQVHGNRYDYLRFSHLGLLRLFRKFEEIVSGAAGGPGMALAWSYRYFLLSFVKSTKARLLASIFAHFTGFWLKYFDYFLVNRPGALDASSGNFFLGRKSSAVLSDRDLIKKYKGGDV